MKAKKLHKYLGIPLCFFLFFAALSGILLNHRDLLQSVDIPRSVLPRSYQFVGWNNGAVRGVLRSDSLAYIYGSAGVWVTDSSLRSEAKPLGAGFVPGAEIEVVSRVDGDVLVSVKGATFGIGREMAMRVVTA